jgi:hypothetical protein
VLRYLGILCVNTGNMVLGKAAVEAAVSAILLDGDFAQLKEESTGDLANFEGHPEWFCAICDQPEPLFSWCIGMGEQKYQVLPFHVFFLLAPLG